ncbi:hypothetical protein Echvi_3843 [Echinicola vietnamensis DSM 17526]|uniref:Uncharacterized protein n=1 Tax=Echinicola vietnamensis (strain DSM 17526 / LMG 23754 / KMM 6221) TaxID=926556 RepID=L0G5E8_ECHVK|nr:hypothetical protein Echvi_3843 [Echinicola vietnamensis DSM 17526]
MNQDHHKAKYNGTSTFVKFIEKNFVYLIFNSNICTALEK